MLYEALRSSILNGLGRGVVIGPGVLQLVRKLVHLRRATRSKSENAGCGGADTSDDEQKLRHS
jgi:hypothetical protein